MSAKRVRFVDAASAAAGRQRSVASARLCVRQSSACLHTAAHVQRRSMMMPPAPQAEFCQCEQVLSLCQIFGIDLAPAVVVVG